MNFKCDCKLHFKIKICVALEAEASGQVIFFLFEAPPLRILRAKFPSLIFCVFLRDALILH
jgi:hypothetical protein